MSARIYVDQYGFARSDEGDAWFVGEQYAGGYYSPNQLPRPNPSTNYPTPKVEVGISPERRKQLAVAASAAGDERAAWFLFDNSFQTTLSPKQRGFVEILEKKYGRAANALPEFRDVMAAKATPYTPRRILVRDKLTDSDRRKLERFFAIEDDTKGPGSVLLSYKLNDDLVPPLGAAAPAPSAPQRNGLMIMAIDRLLERREDRFVRSIRDQLVKGRALSDRQREVMVQIFERNLLGDEASVFRKRAADMSTNKTAILSGGEWEARAAGAITAGIQRTREVGMNRVSQKLWDVLRLIDREISPEGRHKGVAEVNRAKDPWAVGRVLQSAMSWLEAAGLERAEAGQSDLAQLFWKAKRELGRALDIMANDLRDMPRTAADQSDDSALRSKLVRLAHQKPELRGYLLPLLREAGSKTAGIVPGWERIDRGEYLDEIWDMYVATYRKLGLSKNSKQDLISDYDTWEISRGSDGMPVAFVISKGTSLGTKLGLAGSNGSSEGKTALKTYLAKAYHLPGYYAEVSHAVEALVMKHAPQVVCAVEAPHVLKKNVEPSSDGVHYKRNLAGVGVVEKVLVGNPRGIETTDSRNPMCPLPEGGADPLMRLAEEDVDGPCDGDCHLACQIDLD